jgi:hypothetical protein
MSSEKKNLPIEIAAAAIGCLGVIGAAIVTGFFGFLNVVVPQVINRTPSSVVSIAAQVTPPVATQVAPSIVTRVVTSVAPVQATFGPITFALNITSDHKLIEPGSRFSQGIAHLVAMFTAAGMPRGAAWRTQWYLNGRLQEKLTGNYQWQVANNLDWIVLTDPAGIEPGQWELRLFIGERQVQSATFTVEKRAVGVPFVDVFRFAENVDADNKPVRPHQPSESFAKGVTQVYAFFDAGNFSKGMKYRVEWHRNGELIITKDDVWSSGANASDTWRKIYDDTGLESGIYVLKFYIESKLAQTGTFEIE